MVNLNTALSADFKLWEFVKSVTADQNGISNLPNETEVGHLKLLCQKILQPAREALGPLKISSGFRSEELNKFIGGVANSDHRLGYAADVIPHDTTTLTLAKWVVKHCPDFDQVILEFGTPADPSWIHLSAAPRNRRQVLRAVSRDGKTVYSPVKL